MSDEFRMVPTPISGMKIAYQVPVGEGSVIAYEAAVDTTIDTADLNELLDRIGNAAERRRAIYELPMVKAGLYANRQLLTSQREERAKVFATAQAKLQAMQQGRRNVVPMAMPDVNAIAQFDNRILDLQRQIKAAELRIPYLEAVIAGEEPPELFPEAAPAAAAE